MAERQPESETGDQPKAPASHGIDQRGGAGDGGGNESACPALDPDRASMADELQTTGHSFDECYRILAHYHDDLDRALHWLLTHVPATENKVLADDHEKYEEIP
jgi:hypothetical protein